MCVGATIKGIRDQISSADILVVNDGSTDETAKVAVWENVFLINHPFNLGYGAALQTGFRFAERRGYEYVFTMDADGQHDPTSLNSLVAAMEDRHADIVIGSRFIGNGYNVGFSRRMGMLLFSLIARMYTGIAITDPTSGFQLLNQSVFSSLAKADNYPSDYPDVNIIMTLHKNGFKITEAPVTMVENSSGKSMHNGLKPVSYVVKMSIAIVMVMLRKATK